MGCACRDSHQGRDRENSKRIKPAKFVQGLTGVFQALTVVCRRNRRETIDFQSIRDELQFREVENVCIALGSITVQSLKRPTQFERTGELCHVPPPSDNCQIRSSRLKCGNKDFNAKALSRRGAKNVKNGLEFAVCSLPFGSFFLCIPATLRPCVKFPNQPMRPGPRFLAGKSASHRYSGRLAPPGNL